LLRFDKGKYLLLLVLHHIAVDGWSVDVLQRELAVLYNALRRGGRAGSRPPILQYADFALWQQRHLTTERIAAARTYWQRKLAGDLAALDLLTDRPRSPKPTCQGATHYFRIGQTLTNQTKSLAKQEQATLFATVLAAVEVVLWRHTQQEDIIVGSPISIRDDAALKDSLGCFLNVLPLRNRLEPGLKFRQLVAQVKSTILEAHENRDYPIDLLKREVLGSQPVGANPFQVMVVMESASTTALRIDELEVVALPIDTQTAKCELLIGFTENSNGELLGIVEYRSDLFDSDRIARLVQHLETVLSAAVATPNQCISELPLGGNDQLEHWNQNERTLPEGCVHQWFEAYATAHPQDIAVAFQGKEYSYGELNARANQLAGYLWALGVGPNVPVAVCLERSFEMVLAVLATMKSGGACVPIDPAFPPRRQAIILADSAASVLLTQESLARCFATGDTTVVRLDTDWRSVAQSHTGNLRDSACANDLAYVIYTSGSTGEPKGVAVEHHTLANLIDWQHRHSQAKRGWRTLQFASLSFDVSFQEIFSTWCSGGTLIVVPTELQRDLRALWKFTNDAQIQRLFIPFVALQSLAEVGVDYADKSTLREVITAGEQLQITPQVRQFFQKLRNACLWNHYGPTETHVATAHLLTGEPTTWPELPPIGNPIDNAQAFVLDRNLQLVPTSVPGELYLGGSLLARGYYRRDDLTQDRFISSPLAKNNCGRLYRTGDICRRTSNGELEFLGRADHQVKIRGHRVELGEVEAVLSRHPAVAHCAVVVRQHDVLRPQLVAFVVAKEARAREQDFTSFVSDILPSFMVPSSFTIVETMPMTPSGKVDRGALSKMPKNSPVSVAAVDVVQQPRVVPDDPTVQKLVSIWKRVLGTDRVYADSNFFALGGDSLAAAILFSILEREFGRQVSLMTLLDRPTVSQLADLFRPQSGPDTWRTIVPLQPHGNRPPLYCLPGIDGHVLNFRHLSGVLGEEQPIIGLQPYGLDGTSTPYETIKQIAARYLAEIRSVQSEGPYFLAGFSLGGVVAFEIAHQLRQQNEPLGLLALIDSYAGLAPTPPPLQRWLFHLRYARRQPLAKRREYIQERLRLARLAVIHRFGRLNEEEYLANILKMSFAYARVAAANMRALSRYHPQHYPGKAILFRAALRADWPPTRAFDPYLGWKNLFPDGAITIYDVAGAHADVLSPPYVESLAVWLRASILAGKM
jgi:nonribosomal peptide synthetase DhbF